MDENAPLTTIAALLRARAGDPNPGLRFEDDEWSWADVVARSASRAVWLTARRGDGPFHIGMLLDNVPEYCFWLGGAAPGRRDGRRHQPHAPRRRAGPRHLAHRLPVRHHRRRAPIAARRGRPVATCVDVDDVDVPDGRAPVDSAVDPATLFVLLFTSGTTGAPKAVKCSQGRMVDIARKVEAMLGVTSDVGVLRGHAAVPRQRADDGLVAGAGRRRLASRSAASSRRRSSSTTSGAFGATHINYVGQGAHLRAGTPERPDDADNPLTVVFGNEAREADVERFGDAVRLPGHRGLRLDARAARRSTARRTRRRASLGPRRADGTVVLDRPSTRAFDEQCSDPRRHRRDRQHASRRPRFEGYWNNAEAEHERTRDGIYWTGDLGYTDEDGFFYFAGRDHDWLRVDGENFAAAPVERILERFPDVELAAVYAVPDPAAGRRR